VGCLWRAAERMASVGLLTTAARMRGGGGGAQDAGERGGPRGQHLPRQACPPSPRRCPCYPPATAPAAAPAAAAQRHAGSVRGAPGGAGGGGGGGGVGRRGARAWGEHGAMTRDAIVCCSSPKLPKSAFSCCSDLVFGACGHGGSRACTARARNRALNLSPVPSAADVAYAIPENCVSV
jgi:hypothetical protein